MPHGHWYFEWYLVLKNIVNTLALQTQNHDPLVANEGECANSYIMK